MRRFIAVLVALLVIATAPLGAVAQDDSQAFRDLATGQDFRVRVAAALALGHSKSPGARVALEKALGDQHPAVRASAAAALGAQGDPQSIAALKAAEEKEQTASVRSQIQGTIVRIGSKRMGSLGGKTKWLVSVGRIDNRSGVNAPEVMTTMRASTKSKIASVPGVEVLADGVDATAAAKSRNTPVLVLDASLVSVGGVTRPDGVGFSARVEVLIRKLPEHALKGTVTGSASALADPAQVHGKQQMAQLQADAITAAVESAMSGAPPAFDAAIKNN